MKMNVICLVFNIKKALSNAVLEGSGTLTGTGGGIYIRGSDNVEIHNSSIYNNSAPSSGAGLYVNIHNARLLILDSIFFLYQNPIQRLFFTYLR